MGLRRQLECPQYGNRSEFENKHDSSKNIFGYRMLVWAIVAIGALIFIVCSHKNSDLGQIFIFAIYI